MGNLNDNVLVQINGLLRLIGQPALRFVNGHTTAHAHMRGQEKVLHRRQMLERLRDLNPVKREDLIARQAFQAEHLPERNPDLPSRSPQETPYDGLNAFETERRRKALASVRHSKPPAVPALLAKTTTLTLPSPTEDGDERYVPESTMQDNVVEVLGEMRDLRAEVNALKTMLRSIFRMAGEPVPAGGVAAASRL